jgi:Ca2+-binding RTX toxin-like protein
LEITIMATRYFYGDRSISSSLGTPNTVQRNDTLYGSNFSVDTDYIYGYRGDDALYGLAGRDYIYGAAGNDDIYGGSGSDILYGGIGSDLIDGGTEADALYGEDGTDYLYGRDGNDVINAGRGTDRVYGGNQNDILYDDGVISSTRITTGGADQLYGEAGNDTFYLSIDGLRDYASGGTGIDTLNLSGRMAQNSFVTVTDVAGSLWDLLTWRTTSGAIERDYVYGIERLIDGDGILVAL